MGVRLGDISPKKKKQKERFDVLPDLTGWMSHSSNSHMGNELLDLASEGPCVPGTSFLSRDV